MAGSALIAAMWRNGISSELLNAQSLSAPRTCRVRVPFSMDRSTMSLSLGFVDSLFLLAARPKQRSAPRAHREQCPEQNNGVDAGASFAQPVYVAQIQPEREFVERERSACSIENRHQPADKDRRVIRARADFGQPAVADQKQNHDADHQMMNVASAHLDEVKRRNLVLDAVDHAAHSGEREKKTQRRHEQPPPRAVGNADRPQTCEERAAMICLREK